MRGNDVLRKLGLKSMINKHRVLEEEINKKIFIKTSLPSLTNRLVNVSLSSWETFPKSFK